MARAAPSKNFLKKVSQVYWETYGEMRDIRIQFSLVEGDDNSLEPLGEHPDAHLPPSGAAFEENEPTEGEADKEAVDGVYWPYNAIQVDSAEWDRHSKEWCKEGAFYPPFDRSGDCLQLVLPESFKLHQK